MENTTTHTSGRTGGKLKLTKAWIDDNKKFERIRANSTSMYEFLKDFINYADPEEHLTMKANTILKRIENES